MDCRSVCALLPVLLFLCGAPEARGSERAIVLREFVFEEAPFPESHASTLIELADGTVLVAWFGGSSEGENDVRIWTARRPPSGPFDPPVAVADEEDAEGSPVPTWNPVLFQPAEGPLVLFYKAGPSPREWWGMVKSSTDGGRSWSAGRRLPEGMLGPIRAKPIELESGTLLFGSSTEHDGWRVHFERADTALEHWQRTDDLGWNGAEVLEAIQPTFLRYQDGRIQALCRSQNGRIVESWSSDQGVSWSPLEKTVLPNPSAGIDAVTLEDGRQLLIYNHQVRDQGWVGSRRRLDVAVTRDGRVWQAALQLENDAPPSADGPQPGEYSYPAAVLGRNGRVHVTYTWRRQRIRYVVIDPSKLEVRPMPSGEWPAP